MQRSFSRWKLHFEMEVAFAMERIKETRYEKVNLLKKLFKVIPAY